MNRQEFLRIATDAFLPFLTELGFVMDLPSISGRFYRVSFTSPAHRVSISYEPGDNELFVMVFSRVNGELSNIDDRTNTPRLADLNSRYMNTVTPKERFENEKYFQSVDVQEMDERPLLKAAKELRLVLPKYIQS